MLLETEPSLNDKDFKRISELVYSHCGISLHAGKKQLVQARIAKRIRGSQFKSVSDYIDHVLADTSGKEMTTLTDLLSTNLTSFFREQAHFDYLNKTFLPALMQRKRESRRIRVWSAGCSTGEEPYSLAMTLLESVQGCGEWDVKLLATDISTRVVQTAQTAVYEADRLGGIDAARKAKYFTSYKANGRATHQVAPTVRKLIQFRYLNLMEPWPFSGPFDFIFCRNVMIYFDKPTQEKLVQRYWEHLDRGGLLFTGHSESLTGINHRFKYVQPTIYAKL
ncbi:MAG TPA: protein-glutamate O-methyltransferase [Tepidisphaeraceae bacterium]|jgi:chemotaxis protein methyltransferase CheR|nr:protein-glutamate O-methyltransferase [Tepidisphaeraceae bacterium]